MKVIETDELSVSLSCSHKLEITNSHRNKRVFRAIHENPGWIELDFIGEGYCIWPNREGEGFHLNRVFPALKKHRCLDTGLSLSWPATASTQAVAFYSKDRQAYLFRASLTGEGYHREIRIFSDSEHHTRIRFAGVPGDWILEPVEMFEEPVASDYKGWTYQFQAGMIGPDGKSSIPDSRGFDYLIDLADKAESSLGPFKEQPVIHVFGYARGHDIGYPDYNPSESLGGAAAFESAVEILHERGFLLSCYLNGRIMEESMIDDYPELKDSFCLNPDSSPCCEIYHGRRFLVMDPNSSPWLEILEKQALRLKSLGVDIVQLDQLAGRAAAVPPGQVWGRGYAMLISRLKEQGMKIWIQGISDYYEADWYEMTWRDLNILEGGIIRGGNPFGETDLRLARITMPGNRYIVPLAKVDSAGLSGKGNVIDVMGDRGELPLIGESYMEELERLAANLNNVLSERV